MINYTKSKIYAIKDSNNDNIIHIGGTVSELKRRYWNHKYNTNDTLNKYIRDNNIDWNDLRIELVKSLDCCDRNELKFESDIVTAFVIGHQLDILDYYLDNI